MTIRILLLLNFALVTFVSAETVYKTRDAEGNILFSDVQSDGAEAIEIKKVQTLDIPRVKGFDNRPTIKLTPKETSYSQLEITSPENDATIRSNESISINVGMTPELGEKHVLVLLMDGEEVSSGRSLQFSLTDLDRGTHTVTALVKNEKNRVLKQSEKLVFHLKKDSKLFKNRTSEGTSDGANTTPAPPMGGAVLTTPAVPSL